MHCMGFTNTVISLVFETNTNWLEVCGVNNLVWNQYEQMWLEPFGEQQGENKNAFQ